MKRAVKLQLSVPHRNIMFSHNPAVPRKRMDVMDNKGRVIVGSGYI